MSACASGRWLEFPLEFPLGLAMGSGTESATGSPAASVSMGVSTSGMRFVEIVALARARALGTPRAGGREGRLEAGFSSRAGWMTGLAEGSVGMSACMSEPVLEFRVGLATG